MRNMAELIKSYAVRAGEVRIIAEGIFDYDERSKLLEFIGDYERLAHEIKARDLMPASMPR
jgi:hypothetical protein